jgi:heparan-alpha-glucosaminide N-acetyltransferase
MKAASAIPVPPQAKKTPVESSVSTQRVASIDILRAMTMVLMIFVNDLWSLQNIPAWLGHVERGVDGIGLADIVFPAFLFIVGLSLPFSTDNRRLKGDSDAQLVSHVLFRSLALLVMGVFLVNGETLNAAATGMPRYVFYPVCCLCFILIWNIYPATMNRFTVYFLRGAAVITLVTFAILYRGGDDGNIERFAPHWWGILGLIGWAYLVSGLVTIFAKNNFYIILGTWAFFAMLSMLSHAGLVPDFLSFIPSAILGGTLTGLTMGGVLTALIFKHYRSKNDDRTLTIVLVAFAALLIGLSIITRPYWGLAKLGATPAWLFLCSAFTILAFIVIYWIADVNRKENWFSIIKPAGTATLLCYLIPYFAYATTNLLGISLPEFILIGGVGLLKSFLFALLCVGITGLLVKAGVRFKV